MREEGFNYSNRNLVNMILDTHAREHVHKSYLSFEDVGHSPCGSTFVWLLDSDDPSRVHLRFVKLLFEGEKSTMHLEMLPRVPKLWNEIQDYCVNLASKFGCIIMVTKSGECILNMVSTSGKISQAHVFVAYHETVLIQRLFYMPKFSHGTP